VLRRCGLAGAPRFLWECLIIQTVSRFPAPAASNPSCRLPAMGLPAGFRSRFMGPIQLVELSAVTTVDEAGNRCTIPASRTATAYSIVSSQDLLAPGPASDEPIGNGNHRACAAKRPAKSPAVMIRADL
jgi:hypothetical protein